MHSHSDVLVPPMHAELGTGDVQLLMADESIAALWENSAAGVDELGSSAGIVRRAVALGRQLLDPISVLASLCGPSQEILAYSLHPLQSQVSVSRCGRQELPCCPALICCCVLDARRSLRRSACSWSRT